MQGGKMREICDTQLRFEFYQSNSKMSKKLEKMSEILQNDRSFLEKIAEDFKTPKKSLAGAKGMTIEQATLSGAGSKGSNIETTTSVRL
jgi:hypothetical protein